MQTEYFYLCDQFKRFELTLLKIKMSIQDQLNKFAKKYSGKHKIPLIAYFMIDEIRVITNKK